MSDYCVHNYLLGGCRVHGPHCPPATVEERLARLADLAGAPSVAAA